LTLQVEWQEEQLAHKIPAVVPAVSFVRAPAHPGYPRSKDHKTVVVTIITITIIGCLGDKCCVTGDTGPGKVSKQKQLNDL